jgi:hypothetical protein
MKFRKKPVVIEAEQFSLDGPLPFMGQGVCRFNGDHWYLETLEGPLKISDKDWIIKGIKGEFYPCKPEIFEATYDPVEA